jgi:chromosome segregation ATPase
MFETNFFFSVNIFPFRTKLEKVENDFIMKIKELQQKLEFENFESAKLEKKLKENILSLEEEQNKYRELTISHDADDLQLQKQKSIIENQKKITEDLRSEILEFHKVTEDHKYKIEELQGENEHLTKGMVLILSILTLKNCG